MTDYLTARERPVGIILLSILHFIGGAGLAVGLTALAFLNVDAQISQTLRAMGIPFPLLIGGVGFLAVLGIASAVGMWSGKRWGWYLGSFWYAYAIVRSSNALLAVYSLSTELTAEQTADMSRGPEYYYVKFGVRIIVSLFIFLYFFKANVREFFGMADARLSKAAVAEFGLCVCIALAVSAAAHRM